ncbi:MAG: right-handed parallel beta-helix repeat-containing protein [Candidatus Komeilibacteria bacterium]
MRTLFFTILLALFGAHAAVAITHHVPSEYFTIQAALDASVYRDTVAIASGVYSGEGNINLNVWVPIVVRSESENPADVIIDGENRQARACISHAGFDLRGVTLTRFNSDMADGTYGVFLNNVSRESAIINCIISECRGGVVYVGPFSNSKIYIWHSVIENNSVDVTGRGLITCKNSGSVFLWDTVIRNNHGEGPGVVLLLDNATTTIERCIIADNSTTSGDAATIYAHTGGSLFITYTSIINNGATGIACTSLPTRLNNVTVAGNLFNPSPGGSGIVAKWSSLALDHSIVWGNLGGPDIQLTSETLDAACSDFPGAPTVGYNISTDPMFCDPANGDYRLRDVSPALTHVYGPMGFAPEPGCSTPTSVQPTTWGAIKTLYR